MAFLELFRGNKFLNLSAYFRYYSRLDRHPRYWHALFLIFSFTYRRFNNFASFSRFVYANSKSIGLLDSSSSPLPGIEVLIVCAPKDFVILPDCINAVVRNSLNPIERLSVVVPNASVLGCRESIHSSPHNSEVYVLPESDFLADSDVAKLKHNFGEKYGWVLQQFLTVSFCLKSESFGVLAVNADTILIRPQAWVDTNSSQLLMVSNEYHEPYYSLLKRLNPMLIVRTKETFITHHMLFQPRFLREFCLGINTPDISTFLTRVLEFTDYSVVSPICIEFEFYAQHMINFYPEVVQLRRFSNISVPRIQDFPIRNIVDAYTSSGLYNSISMHSWMD